MPITGSPWAIVLVSAALLIGEPVPTTARVTDLDTFTAAQLDRDLEAELDDIYDGHDPDAAVDLDEVRQEVMFALSDEGDDDGIESEIDFEDLEAEMNEDHTTVAAVVTDALQSADRASAPKQDSDGSVGGPAAGERPDFRLTRSIAVREVKKKLTAEIRAAR